MKACPYCGRENKDDAVSCHECGSPLASGSEPVESRKVNFKKLFAIGCRGMVALVVLGVIGVFYSAHKKYDYLDFSYEKDYSWQDIEVGTITRLPRGSLIPNGRYGAVLVFKTGQMDRARIVYRSPGAEVAERPKLISSNQHLVVYRTHDGDNRIDLSQWETYPLRSASSSQPVHEFSKPGPAANPAIQP